MEGVAQVATELFVVGEAARCGFGWLHGAFAGGAGWDVFCHVVGLRRDSLSVEELWKMEGEGFGFLEQAIVQCVAVLVCASGFIRGRQVLLAEVLAIGDDNATRTTR